MSEELHRRWMAAPLGSKERRHAKRAYQRAIGVRMGKAKVQRFRRRQIGHMITKERAVLPCGCCILVGVNAEGKATTGSAACTPEHQPIVERANQLLAESLATPSSKLLVDVCATLLTEARAQVLK